MAKNNEDKWHVQVYKKITFVTNYFFSNVLLAIKEIIKKVD